MKLTDPESIQESEKEFIDTINAELDWEAIEKMLLEKHSFTLQEEIDYKDGDLVVYKDNIAYKFDFEIKVPLSVIFNREGECLEISTVRDDFDEDIDSENDQNIDPDYDLETDIDLNDDESNLNPPSNMENNIEDDNEESEPPESAVKNSTANNEDKVAQMASNIADMISEINEGDE